MSTATLNPPVKESIPRAALQFREAGRAAVVFGKSERGASAETPIAMLARSSQPIEHWHWGKLVSVFSGDRADEITKKAAAGVPWEASIDFYGPMTLERVGENEVATCNGMEFTGPGVIVRQWVLNGIAVCPLGADANTSARFSPSNPGALVSLSIDSQDSRAAELMRRGYSPALAALAGSMRFRRGRGATAAVAAPAALATPTVVGERVVDDGEVDRLPCRMGNRNLARLAAGIKMPGRRA